MDMVDQTAQHSECVLLPPQTRFQPFGPNHCCPVIRLLWPAPTNNDNHRDKAVEELETAARSINDTQLDRAQLRALIGIGEALVALHDQLRSLKHRIK
jgi:hypothetical protein